MQYLHGLRSLFQGHRQRPALLQTNMPPEDEFGPSADIAIGITQIDDGAASVSQSDQATVADPIAVAIRIAGRHAVANGE